MIPWVWGEPGNTEKLAQPQVSLHHITGPETILLHMTALAEEGRTVQLGGGFSDRVIYLKVQRSTGM